MSIAREQDVSSVLGLADRWLATCNAGQFGIAPTLDVILGDVDRWLARREGVVLVAREPEPVGFIVLLAMPNFLCPGRVAIAKYWYVAPEHAGVAYWLYAEARKWAKEIACSHFLISASNIASDRHDTIVKFCMARGMKLFETSYIEELH